MGLLLRRQVVRKMAAGMYAVGWPLDARPGLWEVPLAGPVLGSVEDVWVRPLEKAHQAFAGRERHRSLVESLEAIA